MHPREPAHSRHIAVLVVNSLPSTPRLLQSLTGLSCASSVSHSPQDSVHRITGQTHGGSESLFDAADQRQNAHTFGSASMNPTARPVVPRRHACHHEATGPNTENAQRAP